MAHVLKTLKMLYTGTTTYNINIILSKRFYAVRKRFYRKTGILFSDGKYEITLDQQKLKTPKGNLFVVNSEPLALAVAAEWDAQQDTIKQSKMHLNTLCNTAIDNPNNLTKYDMVNYILNYLDTDLILFQSHENDELYKLQVAEWDPIIHWFCDKFQVDLQKSRSMDSPAISSETKAVVYRQLMSYNLECVHGHVYAIDTLKSVILTMACVERFLTPERAALLSRLEEEFQLQKWGRVEWAHDLNQQDQQVRVSATILYIYFNSTSWLKNSKTAV